MKIYKKIKNYGYRKIKSYGSNSFKLFFAITTMIGLPSLVFSTYVFFSGVPLNIIDSTSVVNFFFSFYISAVAAGGIGRLLVFILEISYKMSLSAIFIPKKRKSSLIFSRTISKANDFEIDKEVTANEALELNKYLNKYYLYLVRSNQVASKKASSKFGGINGKVLSILFSIVIFSFIFSGFKLIQNAYWIFLLLPLFGAITVGKHENPIRELGLTATTYQVKEFIDRENIKPDDLILLTKEKLAPAENSFREKLYSQISTVLLNIKAMFRDDFFTISGMIRRDLGLLASILVFLGISLGFSKFSKDISTKIELNMPNGDVICVSPLISTSNHVISYLIDKDGNKGIVAFPHEGFWYNKYTSKECVVEIGKG